MTESITPEEEAAIMDMLVQRANDRKRRQNKPEAYGRGNRYDYAGAKDVIASGRKICNTCKLEKSLSEFYKAKNHPTGVMSECKSCNSIKSGARRYGNPAKTQATDRIRHYKRKYGMSDEEARNLVLDRVGLCEICREFKPLLVDHSHDTNKIRGRICFHCNCMLGFAKDNKDTLCSALDYLDRNSDG